MGLFKKSNSKKDEICSCQSADSNMRLGYSTTEDQDGQEQITNEQSCSCSCKPGCCCKSTEEATNGSHSSSGIEIKVLGSGCKSCIMLYEHVHTALKEMGLQAEVVKITDFAEISGYGVMSTPAMVINEKVVSYGKVLKPAEIKKLLERYV